MKQVRTHIGIALVAAALSALTAEAYTFKVKVDPRDPPEKEEVSLAVPKGAEAASARYFKLAERTHPILLAHGSAVRQDERKKGPSEDLMADSEEAAVEDDAVAVGDKDVEYVVRTDARRSSIVLEFVNRKDEPMTAALELVVKKPMPPVYRRVHRTADGKGWTTTAWQPPRESALYPWTVELAPNSVETVTIGIR